MNEKYLFSSWSKESHLQSYNPKQNKEEEEGREEKKEEEKRKEQEERRRRKKKHPLFWYQTKSPPVRIESTLYLPVDDGPVEPNFSGTSLTPKNL